MITVVIDILVFAYKIKSITSEKKQCYCNGDNINYFTC